MADTALVVLRPQGYVYLTDVDECSNETGIYTLIDQDDNLIGYFNENDVSYILFGINADKKYADFQINGK